MKPYLTFERARSYIDRVLACAEVAVQEVQRLAIRVLGADHTLGAWQALRVAVLVDVSELNLLSSRFGVRRMTKVRVRTSRRMRIRLRRRARLRAK